MKRPFLVWVLLIIVVSGSLFAADYNVLVYPSNENVSDIIQLLFTGRFFDQSVYDSMLNRQIIAESKSLGENLHKAYGQISDKAVSDARNRYDEISVDSKSDCDAFTVNLLDSDSLNYDINALCSADLLLLQYVCEVSDADLLIIPTVDRLQNFFHQCIYAYSYSDNSFSRIYEKLSTDSDSFGIEITFSLSALFREENCGLIELGGFIAGSEVKIDGEACSVFDGFIIASEGNHELEISSIGYAEKTIGVDVVSKNTTKVDAGLQRNIYGNMEIKSNPEARIVIDGNVIGSTPLTLENYTIPLTLSLDADGYSIQSITVLESRRELSIELKPFWMSDNSLLKKAKDEFYTDFARSLLLFGAKIALGAFNDGNNKVLKSLDIAANGALTISIVDLVGSLIDYYRYSVNVTP